MRLAIALALSVFALTACQRHEQREATPPVAAAATVGFQHEPGFDAQGFYHPAQPVGVGAFKLASIAVGAPSDFEAWEGGGRTDVFGPIVLEFDDINSPLEDAENGQRHKVRAEIKPLAYKVGPGQFSFHGKDDKLGDIAFEGIFNTPALAQAKAGQGEGKPALNGTLTVGGQSFNGVSLTYQSGD